MIENKRKVQLARYRVFCTDMRTQQSEDGLVVLSLGIFTDPESEETIGVLERYLRNRRYMMNDCSFLEVKFVEMDFAKIYAETPEISE